MRGGDGETVGEYLWEILEVQDGFSVQMTNLLLCLVRRSVNDSTNHGTEDPMLNCPSLQVEPTGAGRASGTPLKSTTVPARGPPVN